MKDDEKVTLTNGQFTILALFVVMFFVVVFVCIANIKSNGYDDSDPVPAVAEQVEEKLVQQKEEPAPVSLESMLIVKNSVKTPNVKLHIKNITSKKIDAMKVTFYATDGFDEWIRKNGSIENEQIAQNFLLQPNDTIQCEWNLYGMDKGVNFMARVTAVHFSDGTTWHTTDDQYVSIAQKSIN